MPKKVLIYDDDVDILEICTYILEKMGLSVFTKQSCDDVIREVEQIMPDVVIMDNWIPETGGIEATQTLKNHSIFGQIPVILFTASKDVENFARQAGADAFVEKPFDLKTMEEVVRKVLK